MGVFLGSVKLVSNTVHHSEKNFGKRETMRQTDNETDRHAHFFTSGNLKVVRPEKNVKFHASRYLYKQETHVEYNMKDAIHSFRLKKIF